MGGASVMYFVADLPSKKLSLQKIFGLNLHLKSRQVFGNPFKHYASLREARQNFANNDLSLIVARSTGLEPATSSVTGKRSNQLSYDRNPSIIHKIPYFPSLLMCRGWVTIPLPGAYESPALPIELPRQKAKGN